MDSVVVSSPAKINWTLDILSVDERGYHILDMLMQRITLYDTVSIIKRDSDIALNTSQRWLPVDERNTAYKSAQLFFEASEIKAGCEIFVKKNIPSGAGLAGGSADAAAVLYGLNEMFEKPLSEEDLSSIALKIGADVPFMLKNGLYRAGGIGEKLQRLSCPPAIPLLLVMNRRQSASTKKVYGLYDETGSTLRPDTEGFIKALQRVDYNGMRRFGANVLTQSAQKIAPDIEKNLVRLKEAGAEYAMMTGSGSVVFGVFKSLGDAARAQRTFDDCWNYTCQASACGIRIKENI